MGRVRRIAVTGGSGQLGTLIIQRLLGLDDIEAVVCIDRTPPRIPSTKLKFIAADIRDEKLAAHFAGCDTVVHCAFLVTSNAPMEVFHSVNVEGSKNVFRAAAKAGAEAIVYVSSIMAYGSVVGHPVPITEDTPRVYQPAFPYAACKFEVEAFLDTFEPEHPAIAISRLRPTILLGRAVPHVLASLLRKGEVPYNGGAPLPIVSDEDVADLAVLAVERRARGAFIAAADELRTADELIEEFGMQKAWIPKPLVHAYAALDRALKAVRLHLPYDAVWLTQTEGVLLAGSSARAKRELGWSPSYPTASAVVRRFREIAPRRLDRRLALAFLLLSREGRRKDVGSETPRVHLCITGEYGGDIAVVASNGRVSVRRGIPELPTSVINVSSTLLCRLLSGVANLEVACQNGDILFEGNSDGRSMLEWIVGTFASFKGRSGITGAAARGLTRGLVR